MSGLIKNELIKIYKQTAYRVLAIVMTVLIVLTPLLTFGFDLLINFLETSFTAADIRDSYLESAEYYEEGSVDRQFELDAAESYEMFINEDGSTNWKYEAYFAEYQGLFLENKALGYLESGRFSAEELENSSYYWYYTVEEGETPPSPGDVSRAFEALRSFIEKATFADYVNGQKFDFEQQKLAAEAELAVLEVKLKEDPSSESIKHDVEVKKVYIEAYENIIKLHESVAETANGTDDWRYRTLQLLINAEVSKVNYVIMPESLFDNSIESSLWDSYDEYVEYAETEYKTADEASRIFSYSLEKDIPVKNMASNVKSHFRSGIVSVMSLVVIAGIIVFGLTLSSEFSSGTIRLLLIRPKTRTKILSAKIFAALAYVGIFSVFSLACVLSLAVVFGFGIGDLLTPDLITLGSAVIPIPALFGNTLAFIQGLLPVLFYGTIALLLSVLTKKAALSIAIPLVLNSIGATAQSLSLAIASLITPVLVVLLPTSYIDLSMFGDTAADYFVSLYEGGLLNLLSGGSYYPVSSQMFPLLGYLYYIAFTVGAAVLSYVVFAKKQIKD